MDLATISFQPEAHGLAYRFFDQLRGLTVTVVQTGEDREPFDAEFVAVDTDDQGDLIIRVAPWDNAKDGGDHDRMMQFVVYDELERIEVL